MPTGRSISATPTASPCRCAGLTSRAYADGLRARIDPERARPSADARRRPGAEREGEQTTHFSVVDRFGNAVSNTYTLNFSYGLGLVAEGTGILLNNEMDDFAARAGAVNAFGLVQGAANLPGPGKRPLSSMTPTILFRDGRVSMVTGSPGGSRIITITLQTILNVVDHGLNVAEAVAAPRIHHQWLPDAIDASGPVVDTLRLLAGRGHRVVARAAPSATSTPSWPCRADGPGRPTRGSAARWRRGIEAGTRARPGASASFEARLLTMLPHRLGSPLRMRRVVIGIGLVDRTYPSA